MECLLSLELKIDPSFAAATDDYRHHYWVQGRSHAVLSPCRPTADDIVGGLRRTSGSSELQVRRQLHIKAGRFETHIKE